MRLPPSVGKNAALPLIARETKRDECEPRRRQRSQSAQDERERRARQSCAGHLALVRCMPAKNQDLHGSAPDKCETALLLIDVINDLEFPEAEQMVGDAVK